VKGIGSLAAAGAAAAVLAGGAGAATPVLKAYVNDSFKIGLTRGGTPVKALKAGRYVIVVSDPTSAHNFSLRGPGVNKATSVSGTSTARWTVTLKRGTYTYVCDPHASFMKGTFAVR
jgi:plastocyanin